MGSGKTTCSVGLVVLSVLLTACSSAPRSPSSSETSPGRERLPSGPLCTAAAIEKPGWLPGDLRVPQGSRPVQESASTGARRAVFIVPLSLKELSRYIQTKWTSAGYKLGSGGVQGSQFEGGFTKPTARGTFLAQSDCGKGHSILFLGYARTSTPS